MTLDVNPNGNPETTVYALQCTATSPTDANWLGKYVRITGASIIVAVYQTDVAWGNITIIGLQPNTTYTFAVKARNSEGVATALGPEASLATGSLTGACCNPTDGTCTVQTQSACTAAGGSYQGNGSTCTPNNCPQPTGACCYDSAPCAIVTQTACTSGGGTYKGNNTTCALHSCCQVMGDLDGDGVVNGSDIQGFVNAMLTGFDPCADLAAPYDALDMADMTAFVNALLGG